MSDLSSRVLQVVAERWQKLADDEELTKYPGVEDLEREIIAASVVERRAYLDTLVKLVDSLTWLLDTQPGFEEAQTMLETVAAAVGITP